MPAKFNQILILDSIPDGEHNTARALLDDVTVLAAVMPEGGPSVVSLRIDAAGDFIDVMRQCADVAGCDPRSDSAGSGRACPNTAGASAKTWSNVHPLSGRRRKPHSEALQLIRDASVRFGSSADMG